MARAWEYARWRRVTMQAVLCAALGFTIVLAWWMGHTHAMTLDVTLTPAQTFKNPLLPVTVRLPTGWELSGNASSDSANLFVVEPKAVYGTRRMLHIAVEEQARFGALPRVDEVIGGDVDRGRRAVKQPEDFTFMGQPGLLAEFPAERNETGLGKAVNALLYACVVVPGPHPVAIKVRLYAPLGFSPADIAFLKHIAQSIQPVDSAHPAPVLVVPPFKSSSIRTVSPGEQQDDSSDND